MRSSAYECRLAETHRARRLRLLGSPPDLVHSGPVVQGPHPYAEPRSKALSDLVAHSLAVSICYFIIFRPGLQAPRFFEKKLGKKLHCVPSSLRVSDTSAGPLRPRSHVTFAPVARYDAKFRVAWFAHLVRFENLYRTITLVFCLGGGCFWFRAPVRGSRADRVQ